MDTKEFFFKRKKSSLDPGGFNKNHSKPTTSDIKRSILKDPEEVPTAIDRDFILEKAKNYGIYENDGKIYISKEEAESLKNDLIRERERELEEYYANEVGTKNSADYEMNRSELYNRRTDSPRPFDLYFN